MRASSKKKRRDPLPDHFNSLEEAGEFWDTHDSTDYEEYMIPVHFEVELPPPRKHKVEITDQLMRKVRKIASRQGLPAETLINQWVQEKIAAASGRSS